MTSPQPEQEPLFLEAQAAFQMGEHARATTLCGRLLNQNPRHAPAYLLLGAIAAAVEAPDKAATLTRQALNLDPSLAEAHLTLARLLPRLDRTAEASLHWQWLRHLRPKENVPYPIPAAIYYLNREEAATQARVAPMLPSGPGGYAPMLCYHPAPPFDAAPPHLIAVADDELEPFLSTTPLRRPQWVRFDPADPESAQRAEALARRIDATARQRARASGRVMHALSHQAPTPPWDGERPPRLALIASRHDAEAHAAMSGLARALRDQDCAVRLVSESRPEETLDPMRIAQALKPFAPHGVIAANAFPGEFLHPDQFAVSWWLTPAPTPPDPLPSWRARDILLHANGDAEAFLRKLGAPESRLQPLCIDPPDDDLSQTPRDPLLLVVADRPPPLLLGARVREVIQAGLETLKRGEPITRAQLATWSRNSVLPEEMLLPMLHDAALRELLPDVLTSLTGLRIVLLGQGWGEDARMAPLHGGPATHAHTASWLAKARWSLVIHPHGRGSRQAQDAAAHGAIPLVFDGLPSWNPSPRHDPFPRFHSLESLHQALAASEAPPSVQPAAFSVLSQWLLDTMRLRIDDRP